MRLVRVCWGQQLFIFCCCLCPIPALECLRVATCFLISAAGTNPLATTPHWAGDSWGVHPYVITQWAGANLGAMSQSEGLKLGDGWETRRVCSRRDCQKERASKTVTLVWTCVWSCADPRGGLVREQGMLDIQGAGFGGVNHSRVIQNSPPTDEAGTREQGSAPRE